QAGAKDRIADGRDREQDADPVVDLVSAAQDGGADDGHGYDDRQRGPVRLTLRRLHQEDHRGNHDEAAADAEQPAGQPGDGADGQEADDAPAHAATMDQV